MVLVFVVLVFVQILLFFFFNDTATTEIYTLSLHDALPISARASPARAVGPDAARPRSPPADRKSTRLNSSHHSISYAVFCLKKKSPRKAIKSQWTASSASAWNTHTARQG